MKNQVLWGYSGDPQILFDFTYPGFVSVRRPNGNCIGNVSYRIMKRPKPKQSCTLHFEDKTWNRLLDQIYKHFRGLL